MKTKKRIKIGIATTFVIVILMSLCGSRFVFQKACVRRETSWLNMGTADDYIYNLLVDAYNIRKEKNETVTIKASDGINLVGHYYERDKNAPLIIFFHGLWSNGYVSGEPTYKITKNQGWNLLLVSMRAHDESEGEFSTFANNLCGLLKTAKGCMSMNGKTYMANQRIKTCYMVMQDVNHQLFTESVMDEILLSLDNSDEEKAAHEAESIMESLHISEFRDAHPMSLSGGQKQRVAIASAIASDKQVIVFDEPTSGLDYRHMKKVAENLRELSSLGKTLFIVTHDPELIAECCNYFVFIENGKVLWSDGWNRISRERLQRFFAFEGD